MCNGLAWVFLGIDGKDWLPVIAALLALGGVVGGLFVTNRNVGVDRALQTRTQLRQTALHRLDVIRDSFVKSLHDDQLLQARLSADHAVIKTSIIMLEPLEDDDDADLPVPEAMRPPTITDESRAFA